MLNTLVLALALGGNPVVADGPFQHASLPGLPGGVAQRSVELAARPGAPVRESAPAVPAPRIERPNGPPLARRGMLGSTDLTLQTGSQNSSTGGTQNVTRVGMPTAMEKQSGNQWGGHEGLLFYRVHIPPGVNGTNTGYKERMHVYTPRADPQQARPLLVVFHRFSVSEMDVWVNTTFFQEAVKRGWYIMAPLSASDVNFGAAPSRINTEVALEWMTDNFNIRADRIYGVGFSMGGGTAMSYAARHLDPAKPMFAAIVDHTGGISLNDTYANEPAAQFIFDFWFGNGSPGSASALKMTGASMFNFNRTTMTVDSTSNMARNLAHMPVKVFRVEDDPLLYLEAQNDLLVSHLAAQGGVVKAETVPGVTHEWSHLDEFKSINWLSKKKLTLPLSGRTLTDKNGVFFFLTVQQKTADLFTAYDWDIDIPQNMLTVSAAKNLKRASLGTLAAGLDPTLSLCVNMTTADGNAVEYVLRDIPVAPSSVTRDSVPTLAYLYDSVAKKLTLQEFDGGNHVWEIQP